MTQQSSVQWLEEKLKIYLPSIHHKGLENVFTQAKEKHNEEIMDAFQAGKWDWSTHVNHGKNSMDPAEYYNETFKK